MHTFLKMQLKIFYRQISSYIAAIVLSLLNIAIALALYISLSVADPSKQLIKSDEASAMFRSFMVIFGAASAFMTSAFAIQTLFYKYKEEGIYYVIQSKPITRLEIYTATIFAGIIVIISQIFITSLGYLVGTFFLPSITFKTKVLSWLVFFAASVLVAFLSMGIGAIGHNFIQSKSYQFVAGWIPTIFLMIFFFISSPARTKTNILTPVAASKHAMLVKSKLNENEKRQYSKDIANPFKNNKFNYLIENKFGNKTFSDSIFEANQNLYSKIYWADISAHFSSLFFTVNRVDGLTQEFMYANKYEYNESKFKNDVKQNKFIFKVENEINGKITTHYYGLTYNPLFISNLASKKKSTDSIINDLSQILSTNNDLAIYKKREKGFLDIYNNLLTKLDKLYEKEEGIFNNLLPAINSGTLFYIFNELLKNEKLFEIVRNYVVDHVEFSEPQYSAENLKKLTQKELNDLKENPIFTNFLLKYNLVKQTSIIYLLIKLIKEKANSILKNVDIEDLNKKMQSINSLSGLKLVQWDNNNVVEFGVKPAIKWYISLITLISFSLILTSIGGIIYVKKNN